VLHLLLALEDYPGCSLVSDVRYLLGGYGLTVHDPNSAEAP